MIQCPKCKEKINIKFIVPVYVEQRIEDFGRVSKQTIKKNFYIDKVEYKDSTFICQSCNTRFAYKDIKFK